LFHDDVGEENRTEAFAAGTLSLTGSRVSGAMVIVDATTGTFVRRR
jgi:hypothetical protein